MALILALFIGTAAVLSHVFPGPFLFEAFRPSKSVWRVPQPEGTPPALYLTFDDGPNLRWTPAVLDALRDTGARATFFLIDDQVTPESVPIIRRMVADGHAIGLHSGDRWLMTMTPGELAARLTSAAGRIEAIAGATPCRLFRPHAGWRSAAMYAALARIDYRLAGWSWGMWDWDWWRSRDGLRVARRLARKARPGDLIVIHDGHHRNPGADRRHAAETVRILVPLLEARGYTFEPLCTLAACDASEGTPFSAAVER